VFTAGLTTQPSSAITIKASQSSLQAGVHHLQSSLFFLLTKGLEREPSGFFFTYIQVFSNIQSIPQIATNSVM